LPTRRPARIAFQPRKASSLVIVRLIRPRFGTEPFWDAGGGSAKARPRELRSRGLVSFVGLVRHADRTALTGRYFEVFVVLALRSRALHDLAVERTRLNRCRHCAHEHRSYDDQEETEHEQADPLPVHTSLVLRPSGGGHGKKRCATVSGLAIEQRK